ncbi:hypothetical protein EJB05_15851, partial [Eragrostis curvula]
MPAKDAPQQQEPAITAYELQKLRQCMQNNARLQQLGLPMMPSMFPQKCGIGSKEKNKKNTNFEGSESEYDPEEDDTGEGDEGEENTSKNTTRAAKKSNKRAADMPPCGAKTRQKRVVAAQPTTRATRSKKSLAVQQNEGSDGPAGEDSEMANVMLGMSTFILVHFDDGDKYNDEDPNAFDLFKECHYSQKKKGFTPTVQAAIEEMEKKIAEAADGEEPVSVSKVVADVLAQHTKRNKFLQNVGIQDVQPRTSVRNLQEELAEEKRANAELRLVVTTQRENIDVLREQVHEAEEARVKDKEEMLKMQAEMQKKQAETDAKLELLLSQLKSPKAAQ